MWPGRAGVWSTVHRDEADEGGYTDPASPPHGEGSRLSGDCRWSVLPRTSLSHGRVAPPDEGELACALRDHHDRWVAESSGPRSAHIHRGDPGPRSIPRAADRRRRDVGLVGSPHRAEDRRGTAVPL